MHGDPMNFEDVKQWLLECIICDSLNNFFNYDGERVFRKVWVAVPDRDEYFASSEFVRKRVFRHEYFANHKLTKTGIAPYRP